MNALRTLLTLIFCSMAASPAVASTLTYRSADAGRQLTLRRDDARLVLIDDRSRAIVASALASDLQHVVVRGASGSQDDTLTVDLSQPFSLPGGIDYDGGSAGWDTLVVRGGSVQRETITQLTPHDGIFDLDGLVIRYTNLEPITDTAAALNFTINGTAGADTVTISNGPGVGEATISSPTFESVTFANKTNVTFDGQGGGDSFVISDATPPTGLASFIIQGVATVTHTVSFTYPSFGVSATGTVNLDNVANNVTNLEIHTQNGAIEYHDVDGVTIGGVSAALSGLHVTTNGNVTIQTGGITRLADTDGADIVSAGAANGDVFLQAFGIGSNIEVTVDNEAITAPAGSVTVVSGGHVLLGQAGALYSNDIRASDFVHLTALFDIRISGNTNVVSDAFGNNTGGNAEATAGADFLLSDATGPGATFGSAGTAGAGTLVFAETGSVIVTANSAAALYSTSFVFMTTNRLIIDSDSGIDVSVYTVTIAASTVPLDLGSATDVGAALEISDAEVDRIVAPALVVRSAPGMGLTVTQPITFAGLLVLESDSTFSSAGTGSLTAPSLRFNAGFAAVRTWTIDATDITISPGAPIPYSGVTTLITSAGNGNDVFDVTPSASTTMFLEGGLPQPPASPADTLDVDTTGTTAPFLSYTSTPSGYSGSYTFGNRAAVNFIEIETLIAEADLSVSKTTVQTGYVPGGTITYTIVLENDGPGDATNVELSDPLPANTTFASLTAPGGYTCATPAVGTNGTVTCTAATVLSGASDSFTLVVNVDPAATGTIANTASVSSTSADANAANDDSTVALSAAALNSIPALSAQALMLLAALLGIIAMVTIRI